MTNPRRIAIAVAVAILCSLSLALPVHAQCPGARSAPAELANAGADPWPGIFPSFDRRDWLPQYASGRAHLATYVPVVASGVLLRVAEARGTEGGLDRPYVIAALVTAGTGAALGPSMGQWCLGPEARRQSVLPTTLRFAGIGGMVLGVHLYGEFLEDKSLGEVLALSVFLPVALAPGFVMLAYGAGMAFDRTPRVRCSRDDAQQSVSVGPAVDAETGGHGLSLRLEF
jgi:hypothetical protein